MVPAGFECHRRATCLPQSACYPGGMARWSVRQLLVWMLAVAVTAGLSLSVLQAATMMPESLHITMKAGMDMNSSGDHVCKPCGGKSGAGKAMVCGPICANPVRVNQAAAALALASRPVVFTAFENLPTGRPQAPDPYPPRPFNIV